VNGLAPWPQRLELALATFAGFVAEYCIFVRHSRQILEEGNALEQSEVHLLSAQLVLKRVLLVKGIGKG
jgi:hypothetical protein